MKKRQKDQSKKDVESKKSIKSDGGDLKGKIKELEDKYRQMEENWKRSQADFSNFKKRAEGEKELILNIAKAEVVLSFLPVYDGCMRAMEVVDDKNKDGVKKIIKAFESILEKYSICKIDIDDNEGFDPKKAEAVGYVAGEKDQEGQVASIVEMGFTMGDQVIRPAKVIVYKI
ncbi:nucleotide exchange factor GrpE [Patescibacteria group bacterium]|nr:nucleotide exchange factor GrpE [Patescibacteria group bacterium]